MAGRRRRTTVEVFMRKGLDFYREGDTEAAMGAWKLAAELDLKRETQAQSLVAFGKDRLAGEDVETPEPLFEAIDPNNQPRTRARDDVPVPREERYQSAASGTMFGIPPRQEFKTPIPEETRAVSRPPVRPGERPKMPDVGGTMFGLGSVPTRQISSMDAIPDNPDTIADGGVRDRNSTPRRPVADLASLNLNLNLNLMPADDLAEETQANEKDPDEFFGSSFDPDATEGGVEASFKDFDAARPANGHRGGTGNRNTPLELAINNVREKVAAMLERCRFDFDNGRLEEASDAAERILQEGSQSSVSEVVELVVTGRPLLESVFLTHIGNMDQVPAITRDMNQIKSEDLDHTAGFLLSFMDGATPLETLLDASGMSRFEAVRSISRLRRMGLITLS